VFCTASHVSHHGQRQQPQSNGVAEDTATIMKVTTESLDDATNVTRGRTFAAIVKQCRQGRIKGLSYNALGRPYKCSY